MPLRNLRGIIGCLAGYASLAALSALFGSALGDLARISSSRSTERFRTVQREWKKRGVICKYDAA